MSNSSRRDAMGTGRAPGSVADLAARPVRPTLLLLPCVTLVAVLAITACAADAADESQGASAGDAAELSSLLDATDPVAQSSVLNNTTIVPAPEGPSGGVQGTIPFTPIVMSAPVGLDEPSDFGSGVTVRISEARTADVVSEFPGDLGGPSVIVALEFSNSSSTAADLSRTTVNLSFGDDVPAVPLMGPPNDPVVESLEPGVSAVGIYVFSVPEDETLRIELTVQYSADAHTAVFEGSIEP